MNKTRTINETRRNNLRWIIDNRYGGVDRKLAIALGVQQTQITRYFSVAKSRRNISDDMARRIEKIENLDEGWMDTNHPGIGTDPMSPDDFDKLLEEASLSDGARREIIELFSQQASLEDAAWAAALFSGRALKLLGES